MANRIQIRRGLYAATSVEASANIKVGELLFSTDAATIPSRRVTIGDGSTVGGFDFVGNAISNTDINASQVQGTAYAVMGFDGSGDGISILGATEHTVLISTGASSSPAFSLVDYENIASGDFITDLSVAPGANKFVDALTVFNSIAANVNGLSWRPPVDLYYVADTTTLDTQAEIIAAGSTWTVDSVAVANGDRVLMNGMLNATEDDRVYVITGIGGTIVFTQEVDGQDSTGAPTDGDALFVRDGVVHGDTSQCYNGTTWVLCASLNGALLATNNLSDVANPATALLNLGGIEDGTTDTLTNKTLVSTGAGGTNTISIDYEDLDAHTAGDMLYWDGSGFAALLAAGTANQVLTMSGGLPSWMTPTTGTVTVSNTPVTDFEITRFDGTTGTIIRGGTTDVTLDNGGNLVGSTIDAGSIV